MVSATFSSSAVSSTTDVSPEEKYWEAGIIFPSSNWRFLTISCSRKTSRGFRPPTAKAAQRTSLMGRRGTEASLSGECRHMVDLLPRGLKGLEGHLQSGRKKGQSAKGARCPSGGWPVHSGMPWVCSSPHSREDTPLLPACSRWCILDACASINPDGAGAVVPASLLQNWGPSDGQ